MLSVRLSTMSAKNFSASDDALAIATPILLEPYHMMQSRFKDLLT